jgi:ABC-2 type transport system ATP-binding protein
MENTILSVRDLYHRYSAQWAVKDINFELTNTGIYGLLGANGAGKSTIMNIICGVLRQTKGDVFIRGIDIRKEPTDAKRHIGFLPQRPPLTPELNVEEYLTFCARLRLMEETKISGAVEEVMSKVGITHFRKRLIGNLSGGYQQRVGIAQAIIHKPDLVILDEPTNGLDPNQILEARHLIREIAQERTVILSTHILQEVQALCDHIWMINEGAMVFSGTIRAFDNYIVPSALIVTFRALPGITELNTLSAITSVEDLGSGRYRLYYKDLEEATDQVAAANIELGWKLSEMQQEKSSLDMVFSALSGKASKLN